MHALNYVFNTQLINFI